MEFTYDAYEDMLCLLQKNGYHVSNYHNWWKQKKCVILRHDIDNDIEKAILMAELEAKNNVSSTYFVMVTSDFYNIFSQKNTDAIRNIKSLGHNIGLHFDEMAYHNIYENIGEMREKVLLETGVLEKILGEKIEAVSMHRPSRATLEANITIPGLINSYSRTFFEKFKYLSDSRRNWRESVLDVIKSNEYDRLHILTHAFWYNEENVSLHESVKSFVNSANMQRYEKYNDNITDLQDILLKTEVN